MARMLLILVAAEFSQTVSEAVEPSTKTGRLFGRTSRMRLLVRSEM